MELADLMVEIEQYMSNRGLTHSDSIQALLEAMGEDITEDL